MLQAFFAVLQGYKILKSMAGEDENRILSVLLKNKSNALFKIHIIYKYSALFSGTIFSRSIKYKNKTLYRGIIKAKLLY